MGMEQVIRFPEGAVPAWPVVQALLAERGFPVQTRMIDGELAFPDEVPPEDWREVRVGTAGGMVTVRREPGRLTCVTWGNADAGLRQAWNALAWAFAEAGGGQVESQSGPLAAEEYRRTADLPPGLRPG
jgi:hypothetical protein